MLSGTWIANTNFQAQISETSWQEATDKIGDLNTVALLTFHINYYLEGINHVFAGGTLDIKDKFSFDMPEINSEQEWQSLVERFVENAKKFVNAVENLSHDMLDQPFTDAKYGSYQRNIEGVIEHSYYHLGQVVLIRKLVSARLQKS